MPRSVEYAPKIQRRFLVAGGIATGVFLLALAIIIVQKIRVDPDTAFLFSEQGAKWIRLQTPIDLVAHVRQKPRTYLTFFRIKFTLNEIPPPVVLNIRAMKLAGVFLDKKLIYVSAKNPNHWKKTRRVDLTPKLTPGSHELFIKVLNQNGPPALLAYCRSLKIITDQRWEASNDGKTWTQAVPVDIIHPPSLSYKFKRTDKAFVSKLPFFMPIFISVFIFSLFMPKLVMQAWFDGTFFTPGSVRWMLMAIWAVFSANNIAKIPWDIGMDALYHLKYILYVAENLRIPLATEGVKMFEAPMFYVLAAIGYKVLRIFFSREAAFILLRILPILCGGLQIELCYRALRYVYPHRNGLQITGMVVGSLLPMNLYMSQVVGTEPLAGFFSGLVVVMVLRSLRASHEPSRAFFLLMGLFLGLSILTKVTAILLVPSVIFFLAYALSVNSDAAGLPGRNIAGQIGLVVGMAVLVCGWYYVRNRIELGQFFIGGWEPTQKAVWWQEPGYRTPKQFIAYGTSLFYPVYSGVMGLWDSLYSTMWADGFLSGIGEFEGGPPWNFGFMLSSMWWSILPSVAIIFGILKALLNPGQSLRKGQLFAVSCVAIYFLAIFYLFLVVPIYSAGKATYTLGLIPAYAVLFAYGFDILTRSLFTKALFQSIIVCWAANALFSYWVVR